MITPKTQDDLDQGTKVYLTNVEKLSPSNQEYINFMGRIQGSKIRSQSALTQNKYESNTPIKEEDLQKENQHNIIEIPISHSFDKKMSLSTQSK